MEGYEALATCDEVNVVYVGTINTTHLQVVKVIYFFFKVSYDLIKIEAKLDYRYQIPDPYITR